MDETLRGLEEVLSARGIRLFAIIDHSGEAERVEIRIQMPNTRLVIFGHPKAGTPIMLASHSAALDLPLTILVAEGSEGTFRSRTTAETTFRLGMVSRRLSRTVLPA